MTTLTQRPARPSAAGARRMRWLAALGATALAIGASACGGGDDDDGGTGTSAGSGSSGPTTLNVRLPLDYPSLDAMVDGVNSLGWAAVTPGYDRLVTVTKDGTGFGPYLATEWEQTPTTVRFTVRDDARCTNGDVLAPTDIRNSLQRFIDVEKRGGSPASTSAGGWGPGPWSVSADDASRTVTLEVGTPYRNLIGLFAGLPIICPEGLAALERDPTALENAVYGSGPYELVSAEHSNEIVWRLRDDWAWGPPDTSTDTMPDNLVFRIIEEASTAANLLVTGDLDLGTLAGPDVERLLGDDQLGYVGAANWHVSGLQFNMRRGRMFELGTGDALREAIFLAVDPAAFNTTVFDGRAELTPTMFRTTAECYSEEAGAERPAPSVEAARQALTDAGYEIVDGRLSLDGRPVPAINLLSSVSFFPNGGAYVLGVLEELGLRVRLNDASATYGPDAIGGNFDLFVQFANRPSPEPGSQINANVGRAPPDGANIGATGLGDPSWDRTYDEAMATLGEESCARFGELQRSGNANHYYVPLVSPNYDVFYREDTFEGELPVWPPDVFGFPWYYVSVN